MKSWTTGQRIVLVLVIAASLLGLWALSVRRTRTGSPPLEYSGADGRVEDVSGTVAFVDVTTVDLRAGKILRRQTVLVEAGRIAAVGRSRSVSLPSDTHRVDGRGRYLVAVSGFGADVDLAGLLRDRATSGVSLCEAVAASGGVGGPTREPLSGSGTSRAITVGLAADMILLDADPFEDTSNLSRCAGVMIGGRWVSEAGLRQLLGRT